MDRIKCGRCGGCRADSGPDLGCKRCASDDVAPNVLRWATDKEGETPLAYARSLIASRDRNYCRLFDHNADVKLARALIEAHEEIERAWSSALAEAASLVSTCIIDNPNRYGDRLDVLADEIRALRREVMP